MSERNYSERNKTKKGFCSFTAFFLFCLFVLSVFAEGEPTLGGAYFRMMCEYGSYYGRPYAELVKSYSEMAEVGCDGIYSSHLLLTESSMTRCAGFAEMTPEEYFLETTRIVEDSGLSMWPVFHLQAVADLIDPDKKSEIVLSAKTFAGKFAKLRSFRGLTYDEPSALNCYSTACLAAFKTYLMEKHSSDQLLDMGLNALTNSNVSIIAPVTTLIVGDNPGLSDAYSRYLQENVSVQDGFNLQTDEQMPEYGVAADGFRKWLMAKYSTDDLLKMGATAVVRSDTRMVLPGGKDGGVVKSETDTFIEQFDVHEALDDETEKSTGDLDNRNVVLPAGYDENPVLFMEYEEFAGHQFESLLADIEAAVRTVNPDAVTFPVISFMQILHTPFRASVARLGRACGAMSVDPYWDGAQEEGFWAKLMRAQSSGPSFLTISAGKYGTGPARFARDLSLCVVHSPAVNIFAWAYAWKEPPGYSPGMMPLWKDGNYEVMARIFNRIEKVREYLAPSSSTAKVALVYSERDSMWDQSGCVAWPRTGGFVDNCYGLHCAFAQAGIQYEPIFEQFITEEELKGFAVVILPGNTYLRPESVSAIETWVKAGGALITLGDVGKKDRWGRVVTESSLKHLLGVVEARATLSTSFSFNADAGSELEVRYGIGLPAFSYVLADAKKLGTWKDGATAVAVNITGKGRVYSVGTERLGLCYVGSGGGRRFPVLKEFFPGILEFLKEIVMSAMAERKDELALQGLKRPVHTEVTVRNQAGRYVVHLINFDSHTPLVEDVLVTIRIPPGAEPVVFYPEDMSRAKFAVSGQDVTVTVRDFDVYELFVVQYDGKEEELKEACSGVFILPAESDAGKQHEGRKYR